MKRTKLSVRCNCCQHVDRLQIDKGLLAGRSKASLSREYNVSVASLTNHEGHISRQLADAMGKKQILESIDLLSEIETLLEKSKGILTIAENEKRYGLALAAIKESRGTCELLAKIAISLHEVRLVELQIERERSGEASQDRHADFQQRLGVLSNAELQMLEKLALKIQKQSKEVILADPPKEIFPEYHHQPEPEPEQEEEDEEEGLRVRPIESIRIPG